MKMPICFFSVSLSKDDGVERSRVSSVKQTVILRRSWQPSTQALLGELVFRLPGFRGGSGI